MARIKYDKKQKRTPKDIVAEMRSKATALKDDTLVTISEWARNEYMAKELEYFADQLEKIID